MNTKCTLTTIRKTATAACAIALCIVAGLVPTQAQTLYLAKEYVRVNGRVVAIGQGPLPSLSAPVYQTFAYLNTAPTSGWLVVGAGDFDGNGVPDLVYMNTSTRQVIVNYYGGTGGATLTGWAYLNSAGDPGWTVVAVADINGDGVPDLIWQKDATRQITVNYYGGTGGSTLSGWNWLNSGGDPGWTVVAAADFDGNGTPDLVWQNLSTAQVTVNYYSFTGGVPTYTGWNWLNQAGTPGLTVNGAADMNGDGVPDLILENGSTGQATVNFYGGAAGAVNQGSATLGSNHAGWRVAAVADFDGNGEPDLVWQQTASPNAVTVNYYGRP